MKRWIIGIIAVGLALVLLSQTAVPIVADDGWYEGKEEDIFGKSFQDEYWTSHITNTTSNGAEVNFTVSWVNNSGAQVFLVALKDAVNDQEKGVLPYQLLGFHYYTPKGREIFVGALLAFLMAYNDTNGNHVQDPGNEPCYYLIPFGAANATKNPEHVPETIPNPVQKVGEGHYRFGMTYKNLFVKVVDFNATATVLAFPLALLMPLFIAKISELTITYDVTIDDDSGELKVETFYTIGPVEKFWLIAGIIEQDVSEILTPQWGLSAVHYVATFASKTKFSQSNGNQIQKAMDEITDQDLDVKVGDDDERAFRVGTRGTYDLINKTGSVVSQDNEAYNLLLQTRLADKLVVAWQLGFSAKVFANMAYGISKTVRMRYNSPEDLAKKSLNPFNPQGFLAGDMWYAVCFSPWEGEKVVHDPVYTAYFTSDPDIAAEDESEQVCGMTALAPTFLLITGFVWRKRRKH